jgi:methylglutaconyl-CoA hydratase
VLAADNAVFSIAEVRWGLHASIIIRSWPTRSACASCAAYALTGERFNAAEACRIGLVHKVVPLADLEAEGARDCGSLARERAGRHPKTKAWISNRPGAISTTREFDALIESHSAKAPVGRGRRRARLVRREARRGQGWSRAA